MPAFISSAIAERQSSIWRCRCVLDVETRRLFARFYFALHLAVKDYVKQTKTSL
jgi:hypothetical protein